MFPAPFPKTVSRRTPPPRIFALCLAASAALFVGCKNDVNDNSFADSHELNAKLIGEWRFGYDTDKDGVNDSYEWYKIGDDATLSYGYGSLEGTDSTAFSGIIVYVANFNEKAGVIIIKYDSGKEQQWYDYDYTDPENLILTERQRQGNFYGIYYDALTKTTVKLGNSTNLADNYGPTETATLSKAVAKFTVDAAGDFVDWSMIKPQTKQ
jgi:hypothetical protein